MKNIFEHIPDELSEELIEQLSAGDHVRIERVVSRGNSSPEGFWYDQEEDEFVLLISGAAELLLEGECAPCQLVPGDFIEIPARRRHRVVSTSGSEDTIWLCVFYKNSESG